MPTSFVPLFPGLPGGPELIVVLLIVVLLFGANKLPKLARSSGQAMGEFKKGREEIEDELQNMREETVGDVNDSPRDQNAPQGGQTAQNQQGGQGQRQGQGQGGQGQRQGGQEQGQRQGGQGQRQGGSDTSADEWGSASTNRDRETNRR